MKSAFQSEGALLREIAGARERGGARIWWLGQSGFLLWAGGKTVLFDPYLSDSLTRKYANTDRPHTRLTERVVAPERLTGIDLITSSHNHTDHLDAETLVPVLAANPQAKLLVPRANREFVLRRLGPVADRLVAIEAGESITTGGVAFHGIAAAHPSVERDEQGRCRFLGYVARVGPVTVYHSGDTVMHAGLVGALGEFTIDAALAPINGNRPERGVAGNLNGVEAARLAKAIRAKLAIPHHFDTFEFNTATPEEFEAECRRLGQPFHTLRHGEGVEV
jgi:L-ascorbate metabolism protein UlaG (beta-lactamase superfamily)